MVTYGELSQQEQAEIVQDMLDESQFRLVNYADNDKQWVTVFRERFSDMPDKDVTRYLSSWLFLKTEMDPFKHEKLMRLLRKSPEVLVESAELRRMMLDEYDPRRFYMLSALASYFGGFHGEEFVKERAHMLLEEGQVARGYGEYGSPRFLDVSIGVYNSIISELKQLNAEFIPPDKNIPHAQRKIILAKWLKANWPGCEDLAIPATITSKDIPHSSPSNPPDDGLKPAANPTPETRPEKREGTKAASTEHKTPWWQIGTGLALLLVAIIVLRKVRGKPA